MIVCSLLAAVFAAEETKPAFVACVWIDQPVKDGVPAITVDGHRVQGSDTLGVWKAFRIRLDEIYERSPRAPDPKDPGLSVPSGVLRIEATSHTHYVAVQRLLQIATDSVAVEEGYPAKEDALAMKPFIFVDYETVDQLIP